MSGEINRKTIQDPTIQGLSYQIDIDPDYDTTPADFDGNTAAQVIAWQSDRWRYVGYTVTPWIGGDPIEMAADSLWGVEYGDFTLTDEQDNVLGVLELDGLGPEMPNRPDGVTPAIDPEFPGLSYPVPDMIRQARANLVTQLGAKVDELRAVLAQLDAK